MTYPFQHQDLDFLLLIQALLEKIFDMILHATISENTDINIANILKNYLLLLNQVFLLDI